MARIKYYNPTTQRWEYADSNPLPTGTADGDILVWDETAEIYLPKQITDVIPSGGGNTDGVITPVSINLINVAEA